MVSILKVQQSWDIYSAELKSQPFGKVKMLCDGLSEEKDKILNYIKVICIRIRGQPVSSLGRQFFHFEIAVVTQLCERYLKNQSRCCMK